MSQKKSKSNKVLVWARQFTGFALVADCIAKVIPAKSPKFHMPFPGTRG